MTGAELACHGDGTGDIDRRRPAKIKPLCPPQIVDIGKRFDIRQAIGSVDRRLGKIRGDPSLANAF